MKIRYLLATIALLALHVLTYGQSWTSAYSVDYSNASTTSVGAAGSSTGTGGTLIDEASNTAPSWYIGASGVCGYTNLVAGSGGTPGTYTLTVTGGTGASFTGTYTVGSGGSVTAINITSGGTYTVAPSAYVFGGGSGVTGASATPILGPNCLRSTSTVASGYTNQCDLPTNYDTGSQEVIVYFVQQNTNVSAIAETRINNSTKQMYSAYAQSGALALYYYNNSSPVSIGSVNYTGNETLPVTHVFKLDFKTTGTYPSTLTATVSDGGAYQAGVSPTSLSYTQIATITKTDSTSAVQSPGQMGVGCSQTRSFYEALTFNYQPGISLNLQSAAFNQSYTTTLTLFGASNYTTGTPGTPIITVSGGNATITSQQVTSSNTITVNWSSGGPTANPAVSVIVTFTDGLNNYPTSIPINPMTVTGVVNTGCTNSTGISVAMLYPANGVAPFSIQWQRSPDCNTWSNVSGMTGFYATDTTAIFPTLYFYRAVVTDSGAIPQTVASLSTAGALLSPTVPNLVVALAGDSRVAGTNGGLLPGGTTTGQLGGLYPTAGGTSYTAPTVTFPAPTGVTLPSVTLTVANSKCVAVTITNSGAGMTVPPLFTVSGSGTSCTLASQVVGGSLTSCWVVSSSSDWSGTPTITASCTATATLHVTAGVIDYATPVYRGSGYANAPLTGTISDSTGSGGNVVWAAASGLASAVKSLLDVAYNGQRNVTVIDGGYSGTTSAQWATNSALFKSFNAAASGANVILYVIGTNDAKVPAFTNSVFYSDILGTLNYWAGTLAIRTIVNYPFINNNNSGAGVAGLWDDTSRVALWGYRTQIDNAITAVNTTYPGMDIAGEKSAWQYFANHPDRLLDMTHPGDNGYYAWALMLLPIITQAAGIPTPIYTNAISG